MFNMNGVMAELANVHVVRPRDPGCGEGLSKNVILECIGATHSV
jgi:hypothetical protein